MSGMLFARMRRFVSHLFFTSCFFKFELNIVSDHFLRSFSFSKKKKLSVNWSFPIHFLIWVFTNLSNDGINLCLCSWIIFISYYENSLLG
jgi:hypothetical protein